jgi:uncharacterized protein YkwD
VTAATAVAALIAPAQASAPTGTGGPAEPAARVAAAATTYQSDVFRSTNRVRARHHLATFRHQRCVQRFAVRQATRMANQDRMFHQDLQRVLNRCGLSLAGENVAFGFPDGRSVVRLGWMLSPPHRANILKPGYRLLGVGARRSDSGVWYASQVFGARR